MDLLSASKLVQQEHVEEAVRRLAGHSDFGWLYDRTGREEPDHRYVVVGGQRYPSKAFGFFVAQIAGGTTRRDNDMNVNQAVSPLRRLGYVEVNGPGYQDSDEQRFARQESYYLALTRPGQAQFRKTLLEGYNRTCAISGCSVPTVLEAAHVRPFRTQGEDTLSNGILLRIDLHRLFDADELGIDPETLRPVFAAKVAAHYVDGSFGPMKVPPGGPPPSDLRDRWRAFKHIADLKGR